MKKVFQIAIGGMFLTNVALAQNEVDALRYSQLGFLGGTARSAGMAGSFGALGGDFSTLSTNPAGIGIYRRSEITFTPSFFNQSTTSNLNGVSLQDSKPGFNFGNAGIVLSHYNADAENGWKGFSFGFGYNRTNDFNNRTVMQGTNNNSSLMDVYLADAIANGGTYSNYNPYGTQQAWNNYLLDSVGGKLVHVLPSYGETQTKSVETSGSMGETVISFGGNYDDRIFMGGTIGIPHITYNETSQYTESLGKDTSIYGFKSFTQNQSLTTSGSGVNFKFGMIYKPADWIRIGGAFHSPSYYSMHDDYNSSMTTNFTSQNAVGAQSVNSWGPLDQNGNDLGSGSFDYSLTTPMRAIGSLGFVINKIGLINADLEYVDYSSARLHSSSYDFLAENQAISNKYTATENLKVGTEWRILDPIKIRAGFAYYGSPYKSSVGNDGSRMCYTAGIGFHEQSFFIDIAYVYSLTKEKYYFYDPTVALVDPSVNTAKASSIMMTVGFKLSQAKHSRPQSRPAQRPGPNSGNWHQ